MNLVMVQIEGWRTRFDKNRRISLMKEISTLMLMEEGDYIRFCPDQDGRIYLEKETELYGGNDFENELIRERVKKFLEVKEMMDNPLEKVKEPPEEHMEEDYTEERLWYEKFEEDMRKRGKKALL